MLITDTPTTPDTETGTRRLDLWSGDPVSVGASPDNSVGTGYSARYLSDAEGAGLCADIAVYVIEDESGTFGVEEMATIGQAELEDGIWRPDDSADITYEWASVRVFDTEEAAQAECDRLGQVDQSFALYLRP